MKTSPKSMALLFSGLAVCLPVTSAFGQAPASSPKPQMPMIGGLTRTRVQFSPALLETERKSQEALTRGEAALKVGSLDDAMSAFQEALSYESDNGLAYQRLAEAQTAAGELTNAAASYRMVLYKWPGKNWGGSENGDPVVHMQFALLLLRLNQRAEALSVYQHGYQLLQSEEAPTATTPAGGPLPPMLMSPDYTAAQLEAEVDTVIAIHKYHWVSQDLALADFQHVLRLQPDSAVSCFYLGQIYKFQTGHEADAVKAFKQAEQLGGPEMKPFFGEGEAERDSRVHDGGKAVRKSKSIASRRPQQSLFSGSWRRGSFLRCP